MLVERTAGEFGRLDILVSKAAHQNRKAAIEELTDEEFARTFDDECLCIFPVGESRAPLSRSGLGDYRDRLRDSWPTATPPE